ncbi:hypothetical protein ACEUBT_12050 [Aeromonas bivalvium]|uniref:hypothetical protein n=1 Tax=Aeromonas bivalvium TaxID=440079 RepID=UPI0038D1B2C9
MPAASWPMVSAVGFDAVLRTTLALADPVFGAAQPSISLVCQLLHGPWSAIGFDAVLRTTLALEDPVFGAAQP